MSRRITRVRPGNQIVFEGKKQVVTEVYPYFVRMIDPETKLTDTACLGVLVMMGLEDQNPTNTIDAFKKYLGKY